MKSLKPKDLAAAIAGVAMIVGAVAGVAMLGQESGQVTVVQSPTPVEIADLVATTTTAEPHIILQALPVPLQPTTTSDYPTEGEEEDHDNHDDGDSDDNHDGDSDSDDNHDDGDSDEHGEDDDD